MPPKVVRPARSSSRGQPATWGPHGASSERSLSPELRSSSVPATRSRNEAPIAATERSSSAPVRRARRRAAVSWDHPEGLPLEELCIGDVLPAVVVNCSIYGVFVDVGAEKNALLSKSTRHAKEFARGDQIARCMLSMVNLDLRRLAVYIEEDISDVLKANRMPLEDLRSGMVVEGVIDHINSAGVWVNVFAETQGRLNVPKRYWNNFVSGQVFSDVVIEDIDLRRRKLGLSLVDPEAAIASKIVMAGMRTRGARRQSRSIGRGKAKAEPRIEARSTARAKPKASSRKESPAQEAKSEHRQVSRPKPRGKSLPKENLAQVEVDSRVNGVVSSFAEKSGVRVDLDNDVNALLLVSPELKAQMQKGDHVHGMKAGCWELDHDPLQVERISQAGTVILSMEDPMLEIMESAPPSARHPKATPKSKNTAKPPSQPSRSNSEPSEPPRPSRNNSGPNEQRQERASGKGGQQAWQQWKHPNWDGYNSRESPSKGHAKGHSSRESPPKGHSKGHSSRRNRYQ